MACGSQSRGLNSVRCFPEPVLLPARRSPPGGDAQRIQTAAASQESRGSPGAAFVTSKFFVLQKPPASAAASPPPRSGGWRLPQPLDQRCPAGNWFQQQRHQSF